MFASRDVRPVSLENYVRPRDVKRTKPQSFSSPGSAGAAGSKYAMIREKYQARAKSRPPTASSLSTSSSTSTSSVSSASASSSPSPQSASQTENEAETEMFWNRYKRQDSRKQSIGKFLKRALSINAKSRPLRNCKSKTSLDILEQNSQDQAATTPGEGLYDEVYTETYQQVYYHQKLQNKSKLKNRSKSELVL